MSFYRQFVYAEKDQIGNRAFDVVAPHKSAETYRFFIKLAEQYDEEEIRLTRRERAKRKRPGKPKP